MSVAPFWRGKVRGVNLSAGIGEQKMGGHRMVDLGKTESPAQCVPFVSAAFNIE